VVAVVVGLAIGSLADVSSQSSSYRRSTDRSYAALAAAVVQASNETGAALASVIASAPTLPNGALPFTARAQVQQGLDDAVATATSELRQAQAIAAPPPSGSVAAQLTAVMAERAAATEKLRSTVDQLLGMTPLSVPGSPTADVVPPPVALISATTASVDMGAAGAAFQQADARYRSLLADIRERRYPMRLPASVWVPSPQSTAPLGAVQLDATAPALAASTALASFHHLVLTAVGLEPPAVPPGPTTPGAAPGSPVHPAPARSRRYRGPPRRCCRRPPPSPSRPR